MENVQRLQQVLAEYGLIKSLDTRRLSEGKLIVNYFDIKAASNAYRGLKEGWKEVHVEYIFDSKVQLAPVNESSDSGASEKSEEEGEGERKAKEALENTKQKIKEEYERSDNSLNSSKNGGEVYQESLEPNADGQFQDNDSDLSFDHEALNEGVKVNSTSQFEPQLLPKGYPSSSTIINTDSTNMDIEDNLSRIPCSDFFESGMYANYFSQGSSQFLRTQPVKNIKQYVSHSHTRSCGPDSIREMINPMPYVPNYYKWYGTKNHYQQQVYRNSMLTCIPETQEKSRTEETKMDFTISLRKILSKEDTRTTLMIKNIPNKYTQKMILEKIDINHYMKYDFFYLPIDPNNNCNVGYGFINFVSPLFIPGFYADMNAKRWEKFNSEKVCQLTYARMQGLQAHLEHYQFSVSLSQQVSSRKEE